MSWQTYVDDHLMCEIEGNHLTSAAILGHDGSVWAQSSNFPQLKPEEVTAIMKDFEEPGTLAPTGLHLGGTKYMVIQGEANAVIRGKKGTGGVTIKKTNMALVIGIYDEPMTPGQCNMIVERLGDYLIEQGKVCIFASLQFVCLKLTTLVLAQDKYLGLETHIGRQSKALLQIKATIGKRLFGWMDRLVSWAGRKC
ncbi:hypothetical protein Cgig2_004244 [Carnegiea gigantea]|uniref:Profilin n=1 Tax=Carnegiea gigantea TaxID=171969 RepID=A0A9Q1QBG3_9CARY|nr:hypothetical protein Cgig2_004244 [Carnegiea gigantea]